jgi:hypothetical protein
MSTHVCPGCGWHVSAQDGDGLISSCPDCGQVLTAPTPWSAGEIPCCDTRSLVASPWARGLHIPPELSARRAGPSRLDNHGRNLFMGIVGVLLGLFVAFVDPDLFGDDLLAHAFQYGVSAMIVISGLYFIRLAHVRSKRIGPARSFALPQPLPPEIHALGPPVSCHQVNSVFRSVQLTMWILCFVAGVACAGLALTGRAKGKMYLIAAAGPIVALVQIRRVLRTPNLRILALRDGLVVWHGNRQDIWRWDDIAAIYVKKDPESTAGVQLCSYTLERRDGERLNFHANIEFFDNQLGVRVQHALCRRLLPGFRAELLAGRSLAFGPFSVSKQGIALGTEALYWADLGGVRVEQAKLIVTRCDGHSDLSADLAIIPNPAAFIVLAYAVRSQAAKADSAGEFYEGPPSYY